MVLKEESDRRLLFRFQSLRWAVITLIISLCLEVGAYYAFSRSGLALGIIIVALALLFLYSSVYSWTAYQFLEIDLQAQNAHYVERNLYRRINKTIPFSDFQEIRIFRPLVSGRTAKNWVTALETNSGGSFVIGRSEFGALTYQSAKELAERLAKMMDIHFADPGPGAQR